MRGLYDLGLRMPSHVKSGEQMRREFGFRVPRGHVDDQTLQFAVRDAVQLLRVDLMMPSLYEIGPDGLHEGQKVLLIGLLPLQ